MCQKEFLLFYLCQLWALHVVIKTVFLGLYLGNSARWTHCYYRPLEGSDMYVYQIEAFQITLSDLRL